MQSRVRRALSAPFFGKPNLVIHYLLVRTCGKSRHPRLDGFCDLVERQDNHVVSN